MKIKDLIAELQRLDENLEIYPHVMVERAFKCREFSTIRENMRKRDIFKIITFKDKDTVEYQQGFILKGIDKRRKEQIRLQSRNVEEIKNAKEIITIKIINDL